MIITVELFFLVTVLLFDAELMTCSEVWLLLLFIFTHFIWCHFSAGYTEASVESFSHSCLCKQPGNAKHENSLSGHHEGSDSV